MDLKYKIKRRPRRRTLSIVISADNMIVVRANQSLPERAIAEFVESKRAWISKTLKFNDAQIKSYIPKRFVCGEKFLYLGKEITLLLKGKNKETVLTGDIILIRFPDFIKDPTRYIQTKLEQWYKAKSLEIIYERINLYSCLLNVQVENVKIRSLKRTWANCSRKGVLTFSWRLIMAPLNIIDYVVVHELAHRLHHNHSSRFWNEVERIIPEYRDCKRWLRQQERSFRW